MTTPHYIIVSGYHSQTGRGADWFHRLWWRTNLRHAQPRRVFIIASADCVATAGQGEWICLSGNLGGSGSLLNGSKPGIVMSGCATMWMIGLWIAYANEMDFLYVEQDALVFGPFVDRMYREMGNKNAIFGRNKVFNCSTTIFLVRHKFIPQFVYSYLLQGPETVPSRVPELKIARMMSMNPEDYAEYSFGYDRDRPYRLTDEVFYLQKLTPAELIDLRTHDLITLEGMPNNVAVFSNH